MGGVPVLENIVATCICHIQNRIVSLRATLESSVSISQLSFIISNTLSSTFETGSGNYKKIKMSNNDV